nr:hypothetical protein [Metabacillus idriensis]
MKTAHGTKKPGTPPKTFTGEVSGYYDCIRATEGVVPVIFWNEEDLSSDEVVKIALAYKEEK